MGTNPTKLESIPQKIWPTNQKVVPFLPILAPAGMNIDMMIMMCISTNVYLYNIHKNIYRLHISWFYVPKNEQTPGKQTCNPKSWRFGRWFSCSRESSLRTPSLFWWVHLPWITTITQSGSSKHPTKLKKRVVSVGWFQIITWKTPNLHVNVCVCACACVFFWNSTRFFQLRLFVRFMTIIHII